MTYKRGMTVPQSQPNASASNHHTGSAGKKHLGTHLPAENRSWRIVNVRTLEKISSWVNKHVEKRQPVHLEMKRQVHSENNEIDTDRSDTKPTSRRSRNHTWRKTGKRNQQLEICAPSTGRMSRVPTSAPIWRMISATAWATEISSEKQATLI